MNPGDKDEKMYSYFNPSYGTDSQSSVSQTPSYLHFNQSLTMPYTSPAQPSIPMTLHMVPSTSSSPSITTTFIMPQQHQLQPSSPRHISQEFSPPLQSLYHYNSNSPPQTYNALPPTYYTPSLISGSYAVPAPPAQTYPFQTQNFPYYTQPVEVSASAPTSYYYPAVVSSADVPSKPYVSIPQVNQGTPTSGNSPRNLNTFSFDLQIASPVSSSAPSTTTTSIGGSPLAISIQNSTSSVGKKVHKTKKSAGKGPKKDINTPKPALSAYLFFVTEKRAELAGKSDKSFSDIARDLGKQWRDMTTDEKQGYIDMAKADKQRYMYEMRAYENRKKKNRDHPAISSQSASTRSSDDDIPFAQPVD